MWYTIVVRLTLHAGLTITVTGANVANDLCCVQDQACPSQFQEGGTGSGRESPRMKWSYEVDGRLDGGGLVRWKSGWGRIRSHSTKNSPASMSLAVTPLLPVCMPPYPCFSPLSAFLPPSSLAPYHPLACLSPNYLFLASSTLTTSLPLPLPPWTSNK